MPPELATELLSEFSEAKRRYHLGDLGPTAVNGGRFAEAALRIVDWAATNSYTPLGDKSFSANGIITRLEKLPLTIPNSDSIKLYIPRTARVIYDVRNSRNTAHLGSIDQNRQDSAIVIHGMEWILAELVRIFHNVKAVEAEQIIKDIVAKEVPMIEMFGDFPRVLRTLGASDLCLVLLYWRGNAGADISDLKKWIKPTMIRNLTRTLNALDSKNLLHQSGTLVQLTALGTKHVEDKKLIQPL